LIFVVVVSFFGSSFSSPKIGNYKSFKNNAIGFIRLICTLTLSCVFVFFVVICCSRRLFGRPSTLSAQVKPHELQPHCYDVGMIEF
jgi:hypothetical protein